MHAQQADEQVVLPLGAARALYFPTGEPTGESADHGGPWHSAPNG